MPDQLAPARPDLDPEDKGYLPRFRWRWVVWAVGALTVLGGAAWYRSDREATALRSTILSFYSGQLAPMVTRYREFRGSTERLVRNQAKAPYEKDWAKPGLSLTSLHSRNGLYLRISRGAARRPNGIEAAAARMQADSIGRCLGISPISLRGFYEGGEFLTAEWVDRVAAENNVKRLGVLKDDVLQRAERHVPNLSNMMSASYLLVVLEHGPNRLDHPVGVYLWSLPKQELLLRTRTEASGTLIPARIGLPGLEKGPWVRPQKHRQLAADCSIAARLRELTGEPTL